jgi:hypothetical protein
MNTQILLLNLNAIVCFLIVIRLMTYRRGNSRHRPVAAWFAYVLIVACAAVFLRIVTGSYHKADWAETLINVIMCASLFAAKGNVMRLIGGGSKHANRT